MIKDNTKTNNQPAGRPAGENKAGTAGDQPVISGSLKDELEQEKQSIKPNQEAEELPEEIKKKLEQSQSDKTRPKQRKRKKKVEKHVRVGKAYIKATYNNTMITLTDLNGNVLSWASAGLAGFKGAKKATPYAAQIITRIAVQKIRGMGLNEVSVFVQGVGTGRESAVRALNVNGLNITSIKDVTPIPHNGCRKKKPRRV